MTEDTAPVIDDSFWEHAPADFIERFVGGVNALVLDEARAIGRLLDWVGVASLSPQSERVLILCTEYLSRTGQMSVDDAFAIGREVMASSPAEPRGLA